MKVDECKYPEIDGQMIARIKKGLDKEIIGHTEAKNAILSTIYQCCLLNSDDPVILVLYGGSGPGKTETAKVISNTIGGKATRIQMSGAQTSGAADYIFGYSHGKSSLSADLLRRETNIIILDEFDKANPAFHNVFYEMFDEGIYEDGRYYVNLRKTICFLTTNDGSLDEIEKSLGLAIFSRINRCIRFSPLAASKMLVIADKIYGDILNKLPAAERSTVESSGIKEWFNDNAIYYNNVRMLRRNITNAMTDVVVNNII